MSDSSPSNLELRDAVAAYRARTPELALPVAPGFHSRPPRMSPQEHLEWCEKMIHLGLATGDDEERRNEKHVMVEFVL